MTDPFYTSPEWLAVRERVLRRDGSRCSVACLLGGDCSGTLHVHHLKPRGDHPELALDESNLLSVCASHHPTLEAVRRLLLVIRLERVRCPHRHQSPEGRRECERRRRERLLDRRAAQLARA